MITDRPTLSQVQIIQSLAEALSWFEKEIAWGVSPGELGHLTGRIGELYAAMITRGQMALSTNQHGYDVVSAANERISVKTITTSGHVSFSASTFHYVDRIIILRVNVDDENGVSVEEVVDETAEGIRSRLRPQGGKLIFPILRVSGESRSVEDLEIVARASYEDQEIVKYESGVIRIHKHGEDQKLNVRMTLRDIAARIGVETANSRGNFKNTQSLGSDVIRALHARQPG